MRARGWVIGIAIVASACGTTQTVKTPAVAPASARCCSCGTLPAKELVLRGMADPDELIMRLPNAIASLGVPFLSLFKKQPPFQDIEVTPIYGPLYLVRFKQPSTDVEERADRLTEAQNTLNLVREIRLPPDEPYIPPGLRRYVNVKQLQDFIILNAVAPAGAGGVGLSVDWLSARSELNQEVQLMATTRNPDDDYYSEQCGMRAIDAPTAWYSITEAPDVHVAIVDSGVYEGHIDYRGTYVEAATAGDIDRNGHGTHLAGIVGASEDGTTGVVGVAWKTHIKAYRFLDASGRGKLDEAFKQIKNAIDDHADIVLLAWGIGARSPELYDLLHNSRNVLFVAAAGNNNEDTCTHPQFPAAFQLDNVISVMATTCNDDKARFSNYGKQTVDLAAPGEGPTRQQRIYSTVLNDRWGNLAGTSASAAFVAGAAALVLEPSIGSTRYTPAQVKCWLNLKAKRLPSLKDQSKTEGRLDLGAAVQPLDPRACPP